ncbi:hypothetical protein GCM10023165_41980 [Variovorax defluvii]|uniref:MAP3K TRAFs-binding domain-containing protein n=1 Tax=Variovorax defluvii TaxID=913761 RepID=A0ABP8I6T4_9BURK
MSLCFVLMPFGRKPTTGGAIIDFDAVWQQLIKPAVVAAGLEPIRADEELAGGIIHKPMFERLVLCEYAVADLTTANANVFYELGVRHGVKPRSTLCIFAENAGALPFDVALLRGLPYRLGPDGKPSAVASDLEAITRRLRDAVDDAKIDSPLYQLVEDYPNVQHEKTDVFRKEVQYSREMKEALQAARAQGADAVRELEKKLLAKYQRLDLVDGGIVIDLMLSYRAVKEWDGMIQLVARMSKPLAQTAMVREQLAFALNRAGRGDEGERVLQALIKEKGPSSETCGLLGRVYKDRWSSAEKAGQALQAKGWLKKAIDTYLQGFEADWRDAYPGVNAVTLMEIAEPPDERRKRLAEVVSYAVDRRVAAGRPDYWDHATQLELAVLRKDETAAMEALLQALTAVREAFEPETTLNNLRLIAQARDRRNERLPWTDAIHAELDQAHQRLVTAASRR